MTAAFAGTAGAGHYTNAAGLAAGLAAYAGQATGALFAVALLDASMIGAFAVSLSTAYAMGDVLGLKHSLHRGARQAKGFYVMYAGLIGLAAAIVLIPGSPLGLLTEGVQVLAGVLLPAATVFLLLLCNDKAVLGPWVNGRWTNVFGTGVVALLITLSLILTVSVAFGRITPGQIVAILVTCAAVTALAGAAVLARSQVRRRRAAAARTAAGSRSGGPGGSGGTALSRAEKDGWRMPPLATLTVPPITAARKISLTGLWVYLLIAMAVVVVRIVQLATAH
jgi:hypothetical protein